MKTIERSTNQLNETPRTRAGVEWLQNPELNKGTAFSESERTLLGLRGLVPPRVHTLEEQVSRVMENLHRKRSDLERYIFLIGLQDRNSVLFYRTVAEHLEEIMPLVYTPTVGLACQQYGHIFRRPRGIFISSNDTGHVWDVLGNWPQKDVRVIVVTDGERILGLGDLGAHGMGIPVGKLALYTACGGIDPAVCLPITIDAGTDNEELLADPLYIGLPQRRVRGAAYDALIEEFVLACGQRFPRALIQFEDFASRNAFPLLKQWRNRICMFNDDIQGTAAVALAGLYSSLRIIGRPLVGQKILFYGAGEAGTGIANLIAAAMTEAGLTEAQARGRCWFMDSKGLVVKSRADLADHKLPFAHDHAFIRDLPSAIESLKPTVLIGVSGKGRAFTDEVLSSMAEINERPIIFALSNPTSMAECTAEAAYRMTDGRALFASGSPFDPVVIDGRTFIPGQGNNVYIFPGVGLGVLASESRLVTDEMFLAAARALADGMTAAELAAGRIYPPLTRIREASLTIALATAETAYGQGLAQRPRPDDLRALIESQMFDPEYRSHLTTQKQTPETEQEFISHENARTITA